MLQQQAHQLGSDSRDEKRYQERKNKAERARKKKEDTARLRLIVDSALATDPRIKKFKQDEKAARDAKKKPTPKSAAETARAEAAKKAEEDKKAKEEAAKAEADGKAARDAAKKSKEAAKKNLKRDRKAIVALVTQHNYFHLPGEAVPPITIEGYLTETDAVLDKLEPEDVAALRKDADVVKDDLEAVKKVLVGVAQAKAAPQGVQLKYLV